MSQQPLEVPVASGLRQTLSRDLRHVALIFRTPKGPVPVAIATPNIGTLVSYLVRAAQQIAARQPASFPDGKVVKTPTVIKLSGIEASAGSTEGETLLTVKAGPITLGLAIESATLKAALQQLESTKTAKRKHR